MRAGRFGALLAAALLSGRPGAKPGSIRWRCGRSFARPRVDGLQRSLGFAPS
jgi:hypothetical protein